MPPALTAAMNWNLLGHRGAVVQTDPGSADVLITSWAWNELLFALLYLKDKSMQTLTLAMQSFLGYRGDTAWGQMMAMSVLMSLPMMVLAYFGQRYFTEGFTLSGIKG